MTDIKLNSHKIDLTINPLKGACITSFVYKKADGQVQILRVPSEAKLKKDGANASGGYVMVPYASNIKEGSFIYWGIKRKVSDNPDDAVNGDGWKKSWNVDSSSENKIEMSYKHDGNEGFPYPYTAKQTVEVNDNKVTIKIDVTNNFELPMPVGFGFNPFFPKTADVELEILNRNVWSHEGLISISKPYKTPTYWDFSTSRPLGDSVLDTCFGGFDGKIKIRYPKQKLKVELSSEEACHHVFVYNQNDDDYFGVAPSSNAQDAFNIAAKGVIGSGIKTLEPDETCSEVFEFVISEE